MRYYLLHGYVLGVRCKNPHTFNNRYVPVWPTPASRRSGDDYMSCVGCHDFVTAAGAGALFASRQEAMEAERRLRAARTQERR
jgi:hypothetical protein